jgi:2-desacetyl-2-hydroxyethyl bacteriochlorophyllide A dehydrogenase
MAKKQAMKAGVFLGKGRMELRDLPIPKPGKGEVLLKVAGCGVCGTDYHIFDGHLTAGVHPPVVLGHEIAGCVHQVGEGVEAFKEGRFCAVDPVVPCGCCAYCRSARPNLCANPTVIGYKLNGGFEQYMVVPASKLVPMDESVGIAGGIICETLACVLNGYDRLGFQAGSSAMVLGAGTVGLLWATLLRSSPSTVVMQTDIVEFRRDKARGLKLADWVLDPRERDFADRVRAELPDGVEFIVDATGDPRAIEQALPLLAPGGTFMIFGVCPTGSSVKVDPFELYNKQQRIVASKMPPNTMDRSARLIEAGRIPYREIVTATLGLDKVVESVVGFETARDKQVKVAIDPWA